MGDQPTILIVDDTPDVLLMLDRFLTSKGFRVVTTSAPFSVLELIRTEKPALLVLDLMIPGLDGDALARFSQGEGPLPIVFYSAANAQTIQRLKLAHPRAKVVRKGVPLGELDAAIREALDAGQAG